MSTTSRPSPLRPSLQRANASTNSLPVVVDEYGLANKRRPSFSSTKWAALNPTSASASNSPISTPLPLPNATTNAPVVRNHYFDNLAASSGASHTTGDMLRTESADSHRSLRSKSSRKELRELARSATPSNLSSHTYTNPKPLSKKERQAAAAAEAALQQQMDDDDDARSIDSFTCSFSSEFDRQNRSRAISKGDDGVARQRWLDATFRKLSQKSGARRNAPHIRVAPLSSLNKASSKSKDAHFLDFSAIISPVPHAEAGHLSAGDGSALPYDNVTPRPADFQRFPPDVPSPTPRSMDDAEGLMAGTSNTLAVNDALHPTLRTRRSEDSLTVRRRMQRQQDSGSIDITPMAMNNGCPVPRLPDWARSENRTLRPSCPQAASARMARTVSHDVGQSQHRQAYPGSSTAPNMQRATSHDATALHLSFGPSLMSNFDGWRAGDHSNRPLSPTTNNVRSQSAMDQRMAVPLSPSDVVSPTTHHAPLPALTHRLNRGSVSSAASDSDVSSSISSVPQTPVSRMNNLPSAAVNSIYRDSQHVNSIYYDIDPIIEDEPAWQEQDKAIKASSPPAKSQHAPPSAYFMMPPQYTNSVRPTHTPNTSISSMTSSQENHATVRGAMGRPRANTGSSMGNRPSVAHLPQQQFVQRSNAAPMTSSSYNGGATTMVRNASVSSARESPRRSASVKQFVRPGSSAGEKRTSTSSNESAASSGASSNSSGASALLSYMRSSFSKSQSNLSHSKASSSATLHATSTATAPANSTPSPTKQANVQRILTADQVASSIGRRFGRGIAAATARSASQV